MSKLFAFFTFLLALGALGVGGTAWYQAWLNQPLDEVATATPVEIGDIAGAGHHHGKGATVEDHRDRHLFGQRAVHRHRAAARDRQAGQAARTGSGHSARHPPYSAAGRMRRACAERAA